MEDLLKLLPDTTAMGNHYIDAQVEIATINAHWGAIEALMCIFGIILIIRNM